MTEGTVCVIGMHRSGTSAVTRVINLLGLDLGPVDRLMPPHPEQNPAGFWEVKEISDLDEELLRGFGGHWHQPPELPAGFERSSRVEPLLERARDLVAALAPDGGRWCWKDPRASLTLPFWRRVLDIGAAIVCVRNPLEVAGSLAVRNGIGPAAAHELWLRYTTDAVVNAGDPRLVISYEALLSDPEREALRMGEFLFGPGFVVDEPLRHELREFLGPEQRRQCASVTDALDDPLLPFEAKALYTALLAEAVGPPAPRGDAAAAVVALARNVGLRRQGSPARAAADGEPVALSPRRIT